MVGSQLRPHRPPGHRRHQRPCFVHLAATFLALLQPIGAEEMLPYRTELSRRLISNVFLRQDPLAIPVNRSYLAGWTPDVAMTHASASDIDFVLAAAVQPVTFWVEMGSWEGGSAILTARQAEALAQEKGLERSTTTVVAVDTFLGDVRTLFRKPDEAKRMMLKPDGTINLYDRFRANVEDSGLGYSIVPLLTTSVNAFKLLPYLDKWNVAPLPQVIYLDSAHAEGEVYLEMTLAWEALAPGGILWGDDWILADGNNELDNSVQRDVLRFAKAYEDELDDSLGKASQGLRTLGRIRHGLYISYLSFQWFIRKPIELLQTRGPSASPPDAAEPDMDCWNSGWTAEICCDTVKHGPRGRLDCWDLVYTFERCCPNAETADWTTKGR